MKHKVGDVLKEVTHGIIVHGCNARGVMGGGIAKQVKETYPEVYSKYRILCIDESFEYSSDLLGCIVPVRVNPNLIIINAITQDGYGDGRRQVNYDAVAECFFRITKDTMFTGLPIHYPMIGAGLGGGNWNIISTIINETLQDRDHTLWTLK